MLLRGALGNSHERVNGEKGLRPSTLRAKLDDNCPVRFLTNSSLTAHSSATVVTTLLQNSANYLQCKFYFWQAAKSFLICVFVPSLLWLKSCLQCGPPQVMHWGPAYRRKDEISIVGKCFVIPLPAVAHPTLQFCYYLSQKCMNTCRKYDNRTMAFCIALMCGRH